mmetsp:Transcript_25357/g.38342  ORF Transcript_25357/g.38342 Transcript_25357/m.38342 type:complete len:249 (-) Transcript_25357:151-897(-)
MKTSTFKSIFQGLLFVFCLSNCALLAEAKKARKHGFKVVNKTAFPIQVSLNQVGPLYWGIVEPGKTWHRPTGAVWFTIKAETYIEGVSKKLKNKDAIMPIAAVVASTLAAAVTMGASTVASAAAGGAGAVAGAASGPAAIVTGASGPAALAAAGLPAASALAIGGALVGGGAGGAGLGIVGVEAVKKIFSKRNVIAKKGGCYARKCPTYEVTGGPRYVKMTKYGKAVMSEDGKPVANLVGSPMKLRKV